MTFLPPIIIFLIMAGSTANVSTVHGKVPSLPVFAHETFSTITVSCAMYYKNKLPATDDQSQVLLINHTWTVFEHNLFNNQSLVCE